MVWVSREHSEYRKGPHLSQGIPLKLTGGLPCVIPTYLRRKIEKGDRITLRIVLTILSLYRIWPMPSVRKTSTITDPFEGISENLHVIEVMNIGELVKKTFGDQK